MKQNIRMAKTYEKLSFDIDVLFLHKPLYLANNIYEGKIINSFTPNFY